MAESDSSSSSVKKRITDTFNKAMRLASDNMRVATEKMGLVEKTEYDVSFQNLVLQFKRSKEWTEKVVRGIEDLLLPDSKFHVKDFIYSKLVKRPDKAFSRPTAATMFGDLLLEAGQEFGSDLPLGSFLLQQGEVEKKIGSARMEFIHTVTSLVLSPLNMFLREDLKVIQNEYNCLEGKRRRLDSCKARVKRGGSEEKILAAEADLRLAQSEFDRQFEVTKLLLEKIPNSHASNARHLQNLIEAERVFYEKCLRCVTDVSNAIEVGHSVDGGRASAPVSVPYAEETSSAEGEDPPKSATVLYDFDASDESEMSVLANEIVLVSETDEKWAWAEKGEEKGKVPIHYLKFD
ncbi:endophilin-B1-like [Oscarella lobularis]|uniref:endophilin-B1-like n=1 Tax=Oscarella lobularis TaxID=121494 RepID=UPI0033130F36